MKKSNLTKLKKLDYIEVIGAKAHNLKNVNLKIKRNSFTVFTGLSGSGKSSLAFDTIFAEGQRRYVESLSSYARQFLGKIEKPAVDQINGISPAIAIEQKVHSRNPRSTVGTSTEIYEYLKLLFARIGQTYAKGGDVLVKRHSHLDVLEFLNGYQSGEKFLILSPCEIQKDIPSWIASVKAKGYSRFFYGGKIISIDELDPKRKPEWSELFLLIDRFATAKFDEDDLVRLTDSIEAAFYEGRNKCVLYFYSKNKFKLFNKDFEHDGVTYLEPSLHLFSFNNPLGACPRCEGFGSVIGIDPELVVPDKSLSIYEGAVACWKGEKMSEWLDQVVMNAEKSSLSIHKAYASLGQKEKELLWNGNDHFKGILDFFHYVEQKSYKIQYRVMLSRYRGKTLCPDCSGTRLREDARFVKVGGKSINELVIMPIEQLFIFFENLTLSELEEKISRRIMHELRFRLSYMLDVGLGYLDLNRPSNTLSGGESQRIQLATSLGSSLVGSIYILDEPSVGLHPRDTLRLIKVLRNLNNLGNTLIVVEHDEDIIAEADEIVDLGPEAGTNGGHIVFQGDRHQLLEANTLTADYLNGKKEIPIPTRRKKWRNYLEIIDAYENNLKNVNLKLPLGILTCITGVSGSGKSSLIRDVLYKSLNNKILNNSWGSGKYEKIGGHTDSITQIEFIDQNPIGKSSRSNPVTYLKAYDEIRALFSNLPQAKLKGLKPSDFSFNVDGGRCDTCKGEGEITVEMQFMSDIRLVCDECHGKRFKEEILEVQFEGHNISDILALTVDRAMTFFAETKKSTIQCQKINAKLSPLQEVGLGYIHLGQSSSTLSGGEAQRVKLAFFLSKKNQNDHILFLFDEPSTGLHFHDINKLLISLNALVNRGHSVIIIEHHLDIIKSADWVIDLGPEGGLEGGFIVFEGTPEDMLGAKKSYTGKFLASKFNDRDAPRG